MINLTQAEMQCNLFDRFEVVWPPTLVFAWMFLTFLKKKKNVLFYSILLKHIFFKMKRVLKSLSEEINVIHCVTLADRNIISC